MKRWRMTLGIVSAVTLGAMMNISSGAEKAGLCRQAASVRIVRENQLQLGTVHVDRTADEEEPVINIIDYAECAPTDGAGVTVKGYAFDYPYNPDSGVASVTLFWGIVHEEQEPPVNLDRAVEAVPMYCSSFGDNCLLWSARIDLDPDDIPPDPENWAIGFTAVATDNLGNGEGYYTDDDDIRWISFCSR